MAANAGDQGPAIIDAAKHAFVDGWTQSMWLGVGMAGAALVYLLVRGPAQSTDGAREQRSATSSTPADGASAAAPGLRQRSGMLRSQTGVSSDAVR